MARIDITRTELVWPGKYNDDGTPRETPRVQLPFQIIERVKESRATREAQGAGTQAGLFDVYEGKEGATFEDGWRNKLIWGDNLLVMGSLLEKFSGKIDLIYIDPPFAVGADFSVNVEVGEDGETLEKEPSSIEEKAYRDTWARGVDSYLLMMRDRLALIRELLSDGGALYLHCDWRMSGLLRLALDDVFGRENFLNGIVWVYGRSARGAKAIGNQFARNHDVIYYYRRSAEHRFNGAFLERQYSYEEAKKKGFRRDATGRWFKTAPRGDYTDESIARLEREDRIHRTRTGNVRIKYFLESKGNMVSERVPAGDSWDDIPDAMHLPQAERTGYPTQKPEALLRRIVDASSAKGDLVADFFAGSGTSLVASERMGRRWIGCDLGRWSIHVTRKRLLGIDGCQPFEILNLGKYERQYWQGATFAGDSGAPITEQALYEYLAFVLHLYGAVPLPGSAHLHGKRGKAMVHIGAVDAPVTIDEVNQALEECQRLRQEELHVLGWEWEMGMAGGNDLQVGGLMHHEARLRGIDLKLLQIPREVMEQQAIDQGDIRFFELAFLEAEIERGKDRTVGVVLRDFVISNSDLIPEEVRDKVTKWSDWIDYWAVDWDFRRDTFMQGWVTYRTRKDRTLVLRSGRHVYEKPGKYTVLIKVVDIFGNDTSQALDVEVG
ncbi:MAG: site-specific DNA-methyltransferase [Holophagales bacterium]|nr:site-specific DNA-methyltransferase [Holophagales bacterium]MYC10614.1 site-specific DNA-methyltransferase [Holophagales bacterium]